MKQITITRISFPHYKEYSALLFWEHKRQPIIAIFSSDIFAKWSITGGLG